MPITSVTSDPERCTLTVVGDYPVTVQRLWDAYADPRQLERFWGPPQWPATFVRHDMVVGGRSDYVMTGPDGEQSSGYWIVEDLTEGERIVVRDGFADDQGTPNEALPSMTMEFRFESTGDGSRFTSVTTFPSLDAMEQLVGMGMMEGMSAAMGQLDDVLADLSAYAVGDGTLVTRLSPTKVRVSRHIRGGVTQVWRAFRDPDLIRRWMLGPDGWTMPVCDEAEAIGDTYRHEWESDDGSHRFGFEGTLRQLVEPHLLVIDQRPIGTPDGSGIVVESTFRAAAGGTLLVTVMTAPTAELLDEILATGMADGMETSYARLEDVVLQSA